MSLRKSINLGFAHLDSQIGYNISFCRITNEQNKDCGHVETTARKLAMLCIKRRSPDSFRGYTWGIVENLTEYIGVHVEK